MSVTNATIINRALRELNVIAENANATAAQGKQALKKLNGMMELWREKEIDWGWFEQTSTTDTCPIPDYAELAVHTSLALVCASQYGVVPSQELRDIQKIAWETVHNKALSEAMDNMSMSHLPKGTGHHKDGYNIETDS